jgi:hypothetical protein
MYVDHDEQGRRWVPTRDVTSLQDPVRKAAEVLAKDVEEYLYDKASKYFRDPRFLAVAIRRYDLLKTGSGNYAQMVTDLDDAVLAEAEVQPFEGPRPSGPRSRFDTAIRLNDDAREMLAAEPAPKKGGKA